MKILITSIIDLKSSQHNRPHQFVKYLSKKHDVTVLSINDCWKAGQVDLRGYISDFEESFQRVNILHLTDKKISPILQEVFSLKKVMDVAKEGFDVHLNYSTLSSGYMAARGINTVYDIADDLGAMIRASPQIPKILRPVGGAIGDFLIKRNIDISKIVTVTTESLIDSYNIPKSKSKVIPNGVDTELFRDRGDSKRDELKLDGFILGYVGVLREWVDFEPVFMALKDLNKDIKMIVVGEEGYFEQNIELAKRCGVEERVLFTGMVPYTQVPEYISAMDACLIPFRKSAISENALPLKLFEYMACGRPILSSELPGIKRIVGDNILYADNPTDYKKQILKLFSHDEVRSEMSRFGKHFVAEKYEWSKITADLERVLNEAKCMNHGS